MMCTPCIFLQCIPNSKAIEKSDLQDIVITETIDFNNSYRATFLGKTNTSLSVKNKNIIQN